jgi:hypothetical protein
MLKDFLLVLHEEPISKLTLNELKGGGLCNCNGEGASFSCGCNNGATYECSCNSASLTCSCNSISRFQCPCNGTHMLICPCNSPAGVSVTPV